VNTRDSLSSLELMTAKLSQVRWEHAKEPSPRQLRQSSHLSCKSVTRTESCDAAFGDCSESDHEVGVVVLALEDVIEIVESPKRFGSDS
jgi:hypothetical protein